MAIKITSGVAPVSSFSGCNIRREIIEQKLNGFDKAFKRGEVTPEAEQLYSHGSYNRHADDVEHDNKYIFILRGATKWHGTLQLFFRSRESTQNVSPDGYERLRQHMKEN